MFLCFSLNPKILPIFNTTLVTSTTPPWLIMLSFVMLDLATLHLFVMAKSLSSCNPTVRVHCNNKMSGCCTYCPLAKAHQLPFQLSSCKAFKPLELLHLDLWGPLVSPLLIPDIVSSLWIITHITHGSTSYLLRIKC